MCHFIRDSPPPLHRRVEVVAEEGLKAHHVAVGGVVVLLYGRRHDQVDLLAGHVKQVVVLDLVVDGGKVEHAASGSFGGDLTPPFAESGLGGEDDAVHGQLPVSIDAWQDEVGLSVHHGLVRVWVVQLIEQGKDELLEG